MKFIEYTNIKKTADGFQPLLHEASFKDSRGKVVVATYNGKEIKCDSTKVLNSEEKLVISKKLISDWDIKAGMLDRTKQNFKNMGVDPKDFLKNR